MAGLLHLAAVGGITTPVFRIGNVSHAGLGSGWITCTKPRLNCCFISFRGSVLSRDATTSRVLPMPRPVAHALSVPLPITGGSILL